MARRKRNYFDPKDLKTILHSKRANLYYLEHCRVLLSGGRVAYVTESEKESLYFNIPIANTTFIMLGTGTSITQAAVRELSKAGVMIGFCGGGGTPLFAGQEVEFLSPQSEYRPTEYLQAWCAFWFDDERRLIAAKALQQARLNYIAQLWPKYSWAIDRGKLSDLLERYYPIFEACDNTQSLLSAEGRMTRALYALANEATIQDQFTRSQGGNSIDPANRFLDHGNYLAYGLGAIACWVLGLPHGLAVLHGKTRRGGLVFDAADIIKDALVLPQAFISAEIGHNERDFREALITRFTQVGALDRIIETFKQLIEEVAYL